MERPVVLLVLEADPAPYVAALELAGFEALTDESVSERRAAGRSLDLAVLDCSLNSAEFTYSELHGTTPVPTLLMFADEPPAFALRATASSVRDEYALKPLLPDALVYRLQALLIRYNRTVPTGNGEWEESGQMVGSTIGEGHVVSVFAPKGGVGKTTVAVNLAIALREQTRAGVLLFDADVGVGNVTSVIDVPYHLGLADLADSEGTEWTDAAFEQAVTTHAKTGLSVLTWGNDPAQSELISVDLLLAAVRWARSRYSYVVIDNHPSYDDRTMAMLATSQEIFLIVTPEVAPLRNAVQFLELARLLGLIDAVKVIVNRANHGVSMGDVATALGKPVSATIVSSGPKAVAAANEGNPMVLKYPNERMSTDLHAVARLLVDGQTPVAPAPAKRWWAAFVPRGSSA
jgi:pilus assembly protein CpaE